MTPDPEFDHEARRRALLGLALGNPEDAEARQRLAAHVVNPPVPVLGFLAAIGAACAILAVVALLAGLDVTAILLAVAGLYTVVMIRRRRP
ncbi:hypothetical protein [Actinoplanes sp. NPDC089786]|uniref:hypothetical protein n=1 Tax=Actinoplanes sp. NPDC089786 TaxID=3155185 RepID=UPI003435C7AB